MKFKNHIKSQFSRAKEEMKLPEYIAWWVMRLMMITALITMIVKERASMSCIMVAANLGVTFVIPLFSLIFSQKLFFGRLPFRVQTYVDIFVIAGSFFGHFVNLYRFEGVYDKALHVVSGFVTVFIGYELMKAVLPQEKLKKSYGIFGGFMFSYFVMIMWEIFEFFSDFILDSNNQGFNNRFCEQVYTDSYFFFRIFGRGNAGAEQLPILDTMIDILAAVIGSFIALAVLCIFIKEKKSDKAELCEKEETVVK